MGDPNEREPCPHRIIDDVGVAFSMGAIGGTFWHAIKGARSSPKGERLYGSVAGACRAHALPSQRSCFFNVSLQLLKAMRDGSGVALLCGAAFFLRTTARLCISGKRKTNGTQSLRASVREPRWLSAVVRSIPKSMFFGFCWSVSRIQFRSQSCCVFRIIWRRGPRRY